MDIAVVVQRQIASTRAGVMFTIDPATGRTDRLVIEGAFGLGESVVSGSVSPDRYVVDKESLRDPRRARCTARSSTIEAVAGGGTITRELDARGGQARRCSPTTRCARSPSWAGASSSHYGTPQDTEWAFDADGDVWMLQSRPVTSAGGTAARRRPPSRERRACWSAASAPPPAPASGACAWSPTLAERRRPRRGRRARHPHDRARLGAADAPRRARSSPTPAG